MPVVVMYKDKSISDDVSADISEELAKVTKNLLKAAIEVRVLEPVQTFNANEIHIEVKFRDNGEYSDEVLQKYHQDAMFAIGGVLAQHDIKCAYSFYVIPTAKIRSIWAQAKT